MKKKFLVLTLCFTLVFTSINYKKTYADGVIISLPILATVGSLAVATGITLNSDDDLYDIGRLFYNYIDKHNTLTWDIIKTSFNAGVTVLNNNLVSVDSKFLDIVKDFFDNCFGNVISTDTYVGYVGEIPTNISNALNISYLGIGTDIFIPFGDSYLYICRTSSSEYKYRLVSSLEVPTQYLSYKTLSGDSHFIYLRVYADKFDLNVTYNKKDYETRLLTSMDLPGDVCSVPYIPGNYNWDHVESKKENESVSLPIPGNLGQLVGQGSNEFWDNTDLVGNGSISIPNVNSPSIPVDGTVSFPNLGDIPIDTPFANITEYIIGLVVPSDSYWTDTWGSLYNNFTDSFPMVDMNGFNGLSVNGKPFPNIDVKIMGAKGRIVSGDTVNSIVDWLRPIIAGFVFLCLMFFNYRKLYKLIRNSEPFEGIGKVENHAN